MEFCSKCGSRMRTIGDGFVCPKCGNAVHAKSAVQSKKEKRENHSNHVYVSESQEDIHAKILRKCPKCGNREAFHWFSGISGEHAGIVRERAVEHFRCTRCSHSWAESS
jgi:DNA-directed RNA polymerase subunit M